MLLQQPGETTEFPVAGKDKLAASGQHTAALSRITMKKIVLLLFAQLFLCGLCKTASAQRVAVKTNALFWLATTPNLGVEFRPSATGKVTLEVTGAWNPWTFHDDKKMRFWLVQPEVRYWFCAPFEGHFIGVHLHGAQYYGGFSDTRYDGYLAGGGVTYGYNWILSPHWNLEAAIGIGYARLWYKQSPRIPCERDVRNRYRNYFGPTKIGLSFVYLF